jgi:hypothetical protein
MGNGALSSFGRYPETQSPLAAQGEPRLRFKSWERAEYGERERHEKPELATPTMESETMNRVMCGRLYESTEFPKCRPPSASGNQPNAKMMSEFVAHEWNPSMELNVQ